jgi:hypothetical protein
MLIFKYLMVGLTKADEPMESGERSIDGNADGLVQLAGLFDHFPWRFSIATAREPWA